MVTATKPASRLREVGVSNGQRWSKTTGSRSTKSEPTAGALPPDIAGVDAVHPPSREAQERSVSQQRATRTGARLQNPVAVGLSL